MKKLLVATTALVATVGMASAQNVTFGGDARFGIQHQQNRVDAAGNSRETRLEKRFTLNIDAAVESDIGLRAGARLRLRSDENQGTRGINGARVFVSAAGLTVAAGNILGAIESAPGLYDPSVGLTGLGWAGLVTNTAAKGEFLWDAYSSSGNGAEGLEVIYSIAGFTVHISHSSNDLRGTTGGAFGPAGESRQNAIYAAYRWEGWTFVGAYLDSNINTNDKWYLGATGSIGDFGFGLTYADNDGVGKVALNGRYRFGDFTVTGYVADEDSSVGTTTYGIGGIYNLGSGISLRGGVENDIFDNTRADFGVNISF